eukprot:469429_1
MYGTSLINGEDQRELNKRNELSMKERQWCLLVDGFIRSEQCHLNTNWPWVSELNHSVLKCVVSYQFFHCVNHSGHKGDEMLGSGMKYTLNEAKKHALYLKNCVGFTFTEKDNIAVFHSDLHSTDLVPGGANRNELYVFKSLCDDLYIFLNDCLHSGNDLYGSGCAYTIWMKQRNTQCYSKNAKDLHLIRGDRRRKIKMVLHGFIV